MAKLDNVLDALQDRKQPTGRRRMTAANFFLDLPELDEIRAGLTEVSERIGTAPETLLKRLDELQGSFTPTDLDPVQRSVEDLNSNVNRLIKAIEAIKIEVPEKSSPDYEFTVKRNQSGYIKTISAKAL